MGSAGRLDASLRSLCLAAALPDLALGYPSASPCEHVLCFAAAANMPGQTPLPNVAAILPSQTPNPSLPTSSNNAALGAQTLPYLCFDSSATRLQSSLLQGRANPLHRASHECPAAQPWPLHDASLTAVFSKEWPRWHCRSGCHQCKEDSCSHSKLARTMHLPVCGSDTSPHIHSCTGQERSQCSFDQQLEAELIPAMAPLLNHRNPYMQVFALSCI